MSIAFPASPDFRPDETPEGNAGPADEFAADVLRILVETGFLALSLGRPETAEEIFRGVAAARPGHEAGAVGLAQAALLRGDLPEAVQRLRQATPTPMVRAYLGLALAHLGKPDEARALLAGVAAEAEVAPEAAALARDVAATL